MRPQPQICRCLLIGTAILLTTGIVLADYPIVDTGQNACYSSSGRQITCPTDGGVFAGQDAQHLGNQARYRNNSDGTVSDLVTGLVWQQTPLYNLTYPEAVAGASSVDTGGYSDWRLPTIKELYSLINFNGYTGRNAAGSRPYLDTGFFDFTYGDTSAGQRHIDAQYVSSTLYRGTTMHGNRTVFGVNFADGRIKGYPITSPHGSKTFHVRYVRQAADYGRNDLVDNGDGTVNDRATGLMWSKADSGHGMDWQAALAWVQQRNAEKHLGYDDWRLPNAKELQSIVDYERSPTATGSAAIDPVFAITQLDDGEYPYFWTSTTHLDGPPDRRGSTAVYVSFGRALGYLPAAMGRHGPQQGSQPGTRPGPQQGMQQGMRRLQQRPHGPHGPRSPHGIQQHTHRRPGRPTARSGQDYSLVDVHGAGAQRSDPKSGDAASFPNGRGPQGDVIRIDNFVRLVRDTKSSG